MEEQFIAPILLDWKYNIARETCIFIKHLHPTSYKHAYVKDAGKTWILEHERGQSWHVRSHMCHQQCIAKYRWSELNSPRCLSRLPGITTLDWFQFFFGIPTWKEMEFVGCTKASKWENWLIIGQRILSHPLLSLGQIRRWKLSMCIKTSSKDWM